MTKARDLADRTAADLTAVTAGTGISITNGTGPIPTVTNTVATGFDAKGDLIVGTGADTFAKLTVASTANWTLVVDSNQATGLKWAAPADTNSQTLLSTTSLSGTTTAISNISQAYTDLKIVIYGLSFNSNTQDVWCGLNGAFGSGIQVMDVWNGSTSSGAKYGREANQITDGTYYLTAANTTNSWEIYIPNYASSSIVKLAHFSGRYQATTGAIGAHGMYSTSSTAAITSITMRCLETFTAGTVLIYGVK